MSANSANSRSDLCVGFRRNLLVVIPFLFAVGISSAGWGETSQPVGTPRYSAKEVDRQLQSELQWDVTQLAPLTDDVTFLRRVFLDTVGAPPTADDILAFALDSRKDKRSRVISQLIDDPRFGANWATYWRDVVMYRRTEERAGLGARAMTEFLKEQINKNTRWDELATQFVTATGDVRDNGAAGLIMAQGGRPEDTVSEISRIFLGIQIQCAQCHDHPTDRWEREQFHQLAAFFPRVAVRPVREEQRVVSYEVVASDLPAFRRRNSNNRFRGTLEHRMPDLMNPEQQGKLMQPVFFATGQSIEMGMDDQSRRSTLAQWMTSPDNPWFARAYVNRMWSELIGEGFYEPVDDLGPDRTAKAPNTLDYVATMFTSSGYDTKHLVATILNTDAYQRQSRNRRPDGEAPFTSNYAQRLRGDQLFTSLMSVLEIKERVNDISDGRRYAMLRSPRNVFSQTFGYDPSDTRGDIKGSIPQALILMNSNIIDRAVSSAPGTVLGRMLSDYEDDQDLINSLYMKVLSRRPRDVELQIGKSHIRDAGSRREAFEDLLWALLNSSDFVHRR